MDLPMPKPGRVERERLAPTSYKVSERVRSARAGITDRAGRMRMAWRVILIGVVGCVAAIMWLNQTSNLVSLGYGIEDMNKQEVQLNRQAEELQSQIAGYENLQRIQDVAKNQLGMVPSSKTVYVKVPANEAQPAPVQIQTNALNPVTDWWRELTEMLPQPSGQPKSTSGPNISSNPSK